MSNSILRRTMLMAPLGILPSVFANEPDVSKPSYNDFTDKEEYELGKLFDDKLHSEGKVRFVRDPATQQYLNSMVARLARTSKRPTLGYTIQILDVSEVNAAAVPGGFMYVTRGLLDAVSTECQLAGVIGHEIGHVVGRHATNKLSVIFRARSFFDLVKRQILKDKSVVDDVLDQLGGALILMGQLQYSRASENEADLLGYYNVVRAGWNPKGMVEFFDYLTRRETDPSALKTILSTHPRSSSRAQAIRDEMAITKLPADLAETSRAFLSAQAAWKRLPPPTMKSMPTE